jgi:hypothetical protein
MRPAPPGAPPIMGFTGANPVRAAEAMRGGIKTTQAAGPLRPMNPNVPVFTGAPPQRVPASVFNPLSNVGEFYNPKTMVTFAPGKPQVQTPYRDAAPGPAPNAPPVPTYSAPKPTPTMASVPSPIANTAALAPQLPSAVARGGGSIKGIADAVRTAPIASAPALGMSGGAPTGTMASGNKPVVPTLTPTAASKTGGTSAFAPPPATRDAPTSGFMAYSAADPNRALKMMRGF